MRAVKSLVPLVVALVSAAVAQPGGPPRFDIRLYSAVDSLSPGVDTELAVEIDVAKPWHIYHPILLQTGMPTTLEFTVPAGITLGTPQFPMPKLGSTGGIEYLELLGKSVVIVPVHVAKDAKSGPTNFAVDVRALACTELCIPVSGKATLATSITQAPGKPANADVFKAARERLTPSLASAKYIAGSTLAFSREALKAGESGEIALTLNVEPGYHVQDRNPGVEGLIPTRVFIESHDGLKIADDDKQVWPEPKVNSREGVGAAREQSGKVVIRIPVTLEDDKFPSGPVELRVLVQYQACNSAGQCFQPTMAEGLIRFTADTPNPPDTKRALFHVGEVTAEGGDQTARTGGDSSPATSRPSAGSSAATAVAGGAGGKTSLGFALLLAFLGGLMLNVMPCVLPVISIKILSFVQQSADDPKRVFRLGLAFAAGVMVWFWVFALLSSLGAVPLQYPNVVIGISSVLFVMALSLFGVFEIALPGATAGSLDAVASREGYGGAFFKGLLATLLGTACTAPLLAGAFFYAASQPLALSLLVFSFAGIGMSLPYVVLSANPAFLKFVPKPGKWMITFKQSMGFVLLATVVWLLYVLGRQLGVNGVVWTTSFFCFLGFSAWLMGKISPIWSTPARWGTWTAAVLLSIGGWAFSFLVMYVPEPRIAHAASGNVEAVVREVRERGWEKQIPWVPYRKGLAQELSAAGYTTYIDFTAIWCFNCQTNKNISLEIPATRALMKSLGVIPIEADYTNYDSDMEADIKKYSPAVPLNLIYPAGKPDAPLKMPTLFLPSDVETALRQAGPSTAVVASER